MKIRNGIKERKRINRLRRNEKDEGKRQLLWNQYLHQKMVVQIMIKDAMRIHEIKKAEEVKTNRNKIWENIKKLKGSKTEKEL